MLYSLQVLAVDGSTAIVTYDAVIHGVEGDEVVVPHYQRLSDVWVKQGEQWRLRFQQATARRPVD
jgi:ketosteroid isomerase-like protein